MVSAAAGGTAIRTDGLTKAFGGRRVVDDVDLSVPAGSVFGFLGPNGSGKTTTIRMLLGLVSPTHGSYDLLGSRRLGGRRDEGVLHRVGALVEGPAFHPYLSGEANLHRRDAADAGVDPATSRARIGAALDRVGLAAAAGKRYRTYSLGMRQRLGIAAALLRPRELLILDEPTNGLDPQGTREVRSLITELAADGVTVFVSSHLLGEVDQVCTHAAVMSRGALVFQGSMDLLRAGHTPVLHVETPDAQAASEVLRRAGLPDATCVAGVAARATLAVEPDHAHQVERVVRELVSAGVRVRGVRVEREALEQRFLELTGRGFDVSG